MKNTKSVLLVFLFFTLISPSIFAQGDVEMADAMRSNGKIYVVLTVLSIILTGIFVYLILLDRKVRRIEKEKQ